MEAGNSFLHVCLCVCVCEQPSLTCDQARFLLASAWVRLEFWAWDTMTLLHTPPTVLVCNKLNGFFFSLSLFIVEFLLLMGSLALYQCERHEGWQYQRRAQSTVVMTGVVKLLRAKDSILSITRNRKCARTHSLKCCFLCACVRAAVCLLLTCFVIDTLFRYAAGSFLASLYCLHVLQCVGGWDGPLLSGCGISNKELCMCDFRAFHTGVREYVVVCLYLPERTISTYYVHTIRPIEKGLKALSMGGPVL